MICLVFFVFFLVHVSQLRKKISFKYFSIKNVVFSYRGKPTNIFIMEQNTFSISAAMSLKKIGYEPTGGRRRNRTRKERKLYLQKFDHVWMFGQRRLRDGGGSLVHFAQNFR
jgi:hypothetical protein